MVARISLWMFKVFIKWPLLFCEIVFGCLNCHLCHNISFFSHPVLIIPPKTDADTALFCDRLRSLLVRLYLGALAAELRATTNPLFVDHSLPAVCVQVRAYPKLQACSQIGRAHVWTPVTRPDLVCRLLLEKKKKKTHHVKTDNTSKTHVRSSIRL